MSTIHWSPPAGTVVPVMTPRPSSLERSVIPTSMSKALQPAQKGRIVAIIPAHNEANVIVQTVQSLLDATRKIDRIIVMADNCTDNTEEVVYRSFHHHPTVTLKRTVGNTQKKVGALQQAWMAVANDGYQYEYFLGVDADTILTPESLDLLEDEMERNPKLGGLSARYSFDPSLGKTRLQRLLIRLQRLEFASSGLDTIYRKRNTYVLGGQATLFRVKALLQVMHDKHLDYSPWDPDDTVEDMGLTWALKSARYEVKVSDTARAYPGPMFHLRTLWAQRRKWDFGTLMLLFKTKPSIALQVWGLQLRNALDVLVRWMFLILLITSLALGDYHWSWFWIAPPAIAIVLNYKIARSVPNRTFLDTVLAILLMPVEFYLMFRLAIWSVSLVKLISGSRKDGWAAQYRAENRLKASFTMPAEKELAQ